MATKKKRSTALAIVPRNDDKTKVALPGAPNESNDPEVWVAWALNRAEYYARQAAAIEVVRSLGESLALMKVSGRFKTDAWERMFDDNKNPYGTHFPFSCRTSQYFMKIYNTPALFSAKRVSALPASWGTLAQLAAVPAARLERAFERGLITPDMERKDVKLLMPPKHEEPQTQEVAYQGILAGLEQAAQRLCEYLLKMRPFWKKLTEGEVDHIRLIIAKPGATVRELETPRPAKAS